MGLSAPSNQLKAKSWREMDGCGIEALPSSTVGDSAAETPPRARLRNGRTPARFELRHSKKQYVRRVQNSTFGAPYKKKKRAPVRRPKTWRNLAWTIAQMGLSAPPNQLKAKCWGEMDGWGIEARSFAVQDRRRFGCRNTSEGTVPKRQNPSKIRAQAQQKTVRSAGPKQHLWSPLMRRRNEPHCVDQKHGAT